MWKSPAPDFSDTPPHGRVNTTEREASERKDDFQLHRVRHEPEKGAKQEASDACAAITLAMASLKEARTGEMVTLTIDSQTVAVPEGTTILEAAKTAGITIPSLCYLKDLNEIGACRVCVVEVEGIDRLVACLQQRRPGGHGGLHQQPPGPRRPAHQPASSSSPSTTASCALCVRSGNCTLQKLANDLNLMLPALSHGQSAKTRWDYDVPPDSRRSPSASSACAASRSATRCSL